MRRRNMTAVGIAERILPTLVIIAFVLGWELLVRWEGSRQSISQPQVWSRLILCDDS